MERIPSRRSKNSLEEKALKDFLDETKKWVKIKNQHSDACHGSRINDILVGLQNDFASAKEAYKKPKYISVDYTPEMHFDLILERGLLTQKLKVWYDKACDTNEKFTGKYTGQNRIILN